MTAMNITRLTAAFLAAVLDVWAAPATAQTAAMGVEDDEPAEGLDEPRPWYRGVPRDARQNARALFDEGNAFFENGILGRAVPKYLEALEHWDHPNIHYNLALAQMNLDQPVEAHAHFIASAKYGEEPLEPVFFTLAKSFTKLLEGQLAHVRIHCVEPGARVELDGVPLFTAPGAYEKFIRPGPHLVVAQKEGLLANEVARTFAHGARVALELKLSTEEELTTYQRRWSPAVPWTLLAAGAAVAGGGGGLFYAGIKMKRDAERTVIDRCPAGCVPPLTSASDKKAESARVQKVAIGAFAVGGAALVTGAVLHLLNRAHPVRRSYDVDVPVEPELSLAPFLDNSSRGVTATAHF